MERRAEVRVLDSKVHQGGESSRSLDGAHALPGKRREVRRVARPCRVRRAGVAEACRTVLADGLQDPVARPLTGVLDHHQRSLDQPLEELEGAPGVALGGHRCERGQREAAGEDGKLTKDSLLVRAEQPVAPIHRLAQRSMSRRGEAPPRDKELEAITETLRDLRRRKRPRSRRGKFDAQREAVKVAADARDGSDRRVVIGEGRARRTCPRDEELNCL